MRFSDDTNHLGASSVAVKRKEKAIAEDYGQLEKVTGLRAVDLAAKWHILRRMPGDLHAQDKLTELALSDDEQAMFPKFSAAARLMLLFDEYAAFGVLSRGQFYCFLSRHSCCRA